MCVKMGRGPKIADTTMQNKTILNGMRMCVFENGIEKGHLSECSQFIRDTLCDIA